MISYIFVAHITHTAYTHCIHTLHTHTAYTHCIFTRCNTYYVHVTGVVSPAVQVLLVYERDSLLEEVEHLKSSFDEALLRLRHERSHMEATIVAADLK